MLQKKTLRVVGYVAFAIAIFFASLYLTFPAEAVGQRIAQEINKRTDGKLIVSFGSVSPYRFSGVEAEDVQVRTTSKEGEPLQFKLDVVRARLSLLPLIWLSLEISAEIEAGEGTIAAEITPGDDGAFDLSLEVEDINFASPPILPLVAGIPIGGKIAGKAEVEWRGMKEIRKSKGKASLTVRGASLGPGKVQGFTVPAIGLGQLDVAFDLNAGRLRLASFQQKGGDVTLATTASATLRPQLESSSLDVCVEVKPNAEFLDKNPKLKTAMELAKVKFKKDKEGALHVPVGGTFSKPRTRRGLCRKGGRR